MVVYVAARTQVALGDRWYDAFVPLVRRLERDVAVEDEVRRRLAALGAGPSVPAPASRLTAADLDDIAHELSDLAGLIEDEALRTRVEQVRDRVARRPAARPVSARPPVGLAPREVEVLAQVSLGLSNRQVAEALGLEESTVKSYLKNAMRKLHASNRVHAVRLAREAGAIR